jgi:hypothetical protein
MPQFMDLTETPRMLKRAVIGILWAFAAYSGWKLGAGLMGLPPYLDLFAIVASATLGAVVGLYVRPATTGQRRIARIEDRAMPSDGVAAPKAQG